MDMVKESWMEKMLISLNYLIQLYLDATIAIKSDIQVRISKWGPVLLDIIHFCI